MKEDTTYYEPFLRLSFLNRIHYIILFYIVDKMSLFSNGKNQPYPNIMSASIIHEAKFFSSLRQMIDKWEQNDNDILANIEDIPSKLLTEYLRENRELRKELLTTILNFITNSEIL